jgi:hypothetical protein
MGVTIISNVRAMPLFIERHVTPFSANLRFHIIYKNDNNYYDAIAF